MERGITPDQAVGHADEMRLGLRGQVRRCWGVRGIPLIQKLQMVYHWIYLELAVVGNKLLWRWLPNMKKEGIAETVKDWKAQGIRAIIWDGAASHRARVVQAVGVPLISLPGYSPELNPAERVFEEIRRAVEGKVYSSLEEKQQAVNMFLKNLNADPERIQKLTHWTWIRDNLSQLPS